MLVIMGCVQVVVLLMLLVAQMVVGLQVLEVVVQVTLIVGEVIIVVLREPVCRMQILVMFVVAGQLSRHRRFVTQCDH